MTNGTKNITVMIYCICVQHMNRRMQITKERLEYDLMTNSSAVLLTPSLYQILFKVLFALAQSANALFSGRFRWFVMAYLVTANPRYLMISSSLDETYMKYSPATTDDLISFWRSGSRSHQAVEVAKASSSTLGRRRPSSRSTGLCPDSLRVPS